MAKAIFEISRKLGLDINEILAKAKALGITRTLVSSSCLNNKTAEWLEQQLINANPSLEAKFGHGQEKTRPILGENLIQQSNDPESVKLYEEICKRIWRLKQTFGATPTITGQTRNFLLPPPPRVKSVDLLFIGISPNQNAPISFESDFDQAKRFAWEFRYLDEFYPPCEKLHYDQYYQPLVSLACRVNSEFWTWRGIQTDARGLLVEFTDLLPLATEPGGKDLASLIPIGITWPSPIRDECQQILAMEIQLYRPKIIVCNGILPSQVLFKLCTNYWMGDMPEWSMERRVNPIKDLLKPYQCNIHYSAFIGGQNKDWFGRARLVEEIKLHSKDLFAQ